MCHSASETRLSRLHIAHIWGMKVPENGARCKVYSLLLVRHAIVPRRRLGSGHAYADGCIRRIDLFENEHVWFTEQLLLAVTNLSHLRPNPGSECCILQRSLVSASGDVPRMTTSYSKILRLCVSLRDMLYISWCQAHHIATWHA